MASWRSSTTRAWKSTRLFASRLRGCARVSTRRGAATRARWCPPSSAPRRGVSARRRPSWSAPGAGTPSLRSGCGSWPPRARRGWASPGATRPSPRASAPRSTSSCSSLAPASPASPAPTTATATRRTRSRAASRRPPRSSPPPPTTRRPVARASPAAAAPRACCCSRAGTCACAPRASPPPRCAPSAPPRRTPPSTSCCPEDRSGGLAFAPAADEVVAFSLPGVVPCPGGCLQHVPTRESRDPAMPEA